MLKSFNIHKYALGSFKIGYGFSKLKILYLFIRWRILEHIHFLNFLFPIFKKINVRFAGKIFPLFVPDDLTFIPAFYEIFIRQDYKYDLNNVMCIFDIGANFGLSSVYFSCLYPNAVIYAFEPSSKNFTFLQKNITRFKNIKPFKIAVSSSISKTKGIVSIQATKNDIKVV